ncbi:hypothetical protein I3760_04G088100 [Carya illinoinensis]|nr:hypothetical protein I3760_04G088100 [Carya illinoinensis]
MAGSVQLPCKRLVLVAFIMLCLFSVSATARSLRVASTNESLTSHDNHQSSPKEDRVAVADAEDLVSVDYTPATRKPPIHN